MKGKVLKWLFRHKTCFEPHNNKLAIINEVQQHVNIPKEFANSLMHVKLNLTNYFKLLCSCHYIDAKSSCLLSLWMSENFLVKISKFRLWKRISLFSASNKCHPDYIFRDQNQVKMEIHSWKSSVIPWRYLINLSQLKRA